LFATPSSVFEISATFVFSCGTERCKSAKSLSTQRSQDAGLP
jgi:hypothetical protein